MRVARATLAAQCRHEKSVSTPQVLSTASLAGSLRVFAEAGIARVRAQSLAPTAYLIDLLEATGLTGPPYNVRIGTPRDPERRGGHVAGEHDQAARIARALKRRGMVADFRPPDTGGSWQLPVVGS